MVLITERAKQHLKEMLLAKTKNPEFGLRLVSGAGTGRLSLRFDKERAHDQVVYHDKSKILLINEVVSDRVGTVTIEFGYRGESLRLFVARAGQVAPASAT